MTTWITQDRCISFRPVKFERPKATDESLRASMPLKNILKDTVAVRKRKKERKRTDLRHLA
jgi:hypothetical protein